MPPPPPGMAFMRPPIIAWPGLWPLRRPVTVPSKGPDTIGGIPRAVRPPCISICPIGDLANFSASLPTFFTPFQTFFPTFLMPFHAFFATRFTPRQTFFPTFFTPFHTFFPNRFTPRHTFLPNRFTPRHTFLPTRFTPRHTFLPNRFTPRHTFLPTLFKPLQALRPTRLAFLQIFLPTRLTPRHTFLPTRLKARPTFLNTRHWAFTTPAFFCGKELCFSGDVGAVVGSGTFLWSMWGAPWLYILILDASLISFRASSKSCSLLCASILFWTVTASPAKW